MDNFGLREHLVLLSGHISDDSEKRNSYPRGAGRNAALYSVVDRIFPVSQRIKRFIILLLSLRGQY